MLIKYRDLAWLAEKDPNSFRDDHPDMPEMVRIVMRYKYNASVLFWEDDAWHKGFNAGCLATLRLALDLLTIRGSGDKELQKFPEYRVDRN